MKLNKIQRIIFALAVVILALIYGLLRSKEVMDIIIILPLIFISIYYYLTTLHSEEKPVKLFSKNMATLWWIATPIVTLLFAAGFIFLLLNKDTTLFLIAVALIFLENAIITAYHLYNSRTISLFGSILLFCSYILIPLFIVTIQVSAIQLILIVLFFITTFINIYYSLFIVSKYVFPKTTEIASNIRSKRMNKK